jgi:hypothetical protein
MRLLRDFDPHVLQSLSAPFHAFLHPLDRCYRPKMPKIAAFESD